MCLFGFRKLLRPFCTSCLFFVDKTMNQEANHQFIKDNIIGCSPTVKNQISEEDTFLFKCLCAETQRGERGQGGDWVLSGCDIFLSPYTALYCGWQRSGVFTSNPRLHQALQFIKRSEFKPNFWYGTVIVCIHTAVQLYVQFMITKVVKIKLWQSKDPLQSFLPPPYKLLRTDLQ